MAARAGTRERGWRVLPLRADSAGALLDGGLRLLDRLADDPVPTLRWYRSTDRVLVLGRGQPLPVDRPPVPVLARHSGGGAVLMDPQLLCLDVALPAGHRLLEGDLTAVFARVGRVWHGGLSELGIPGLSMHEGPGTANRRGDARARLLAAVCFATVGPGEVLAGGRKLVGLAQRRRRPGALVQCGLLRRWRPEPLLAALGADPDDPEVAAAAVGLDDAVAVPPPDDVVVATVSARFKEGGYGHG